MHPETDLPRPSFSAVVSRWRDLENARKKMLAHLQTLQQRITSSATSKEEKFTINSEVLESLDLEQRLELDQAWLECEIENRRFATWVADLELQEPFDISNVHGSPRKQTSFRSAGIIYLRSIAEYLEASMEANADEETSLQPVHLTFGKRNVDVPRPREMAPNYNSPKVRKTSGPLLHVDDENMVTRGGETSLNRKPRFCELMDVPTRQQIQRSWI